MCADSLGSFGQTSSTHAKFPQAQVPFGQISVRFPAEESRTGMKIHECSCSFMFGRTRTNTSVRSICVRVLSSLIQNMNWLKVLWRILIYQHLIGTLVPNKTGSMVTMETLATTRTLLSINEYILLMSWSNKSYINKLTKNGFQNYAPPKEGSDIIAKR